MAPEAPAAPARYRSRRQAGRRPPPTTRSSTSTFSLSDNQYFEGVGQVRRTSTGSRLSDGCCWRVYAMCLLVDRDRPRATLGRDVFDDVVLAAGLLNDRQCAVAVGADGVAGAWIERNAVGSGADRERRDHSPFVGIGNRHDAVAAD